MATFGSKGTFDVDSTFGSLFIALILTSALWGIGTLQFYLYCEKFWKTEPRWLKVYILFLWILDTAHQGLIAHTLYICFVKGIINPLLLIRLQRSSPAIPALTAFIDIMVQALFIRRVWYLSFKNRSLTGSLSIAALAQFALTLAFFGKIVNINVVTQADKIIPLQLATGIVALFTDSFLAITLIWLLRRARSGIRKSDSVVNRIVTYAVGSSLVTAICVLVSLISAAVAPHSLVYMLADFNLAKLYFNCLLASFNARTSLRAALDHTSGDVSIRFDAFPSSSMANSKIAKDNSGRTSNVKPVDCKVVVTTEAGANESMNRPSNSADIESPSYG